MTSTEDACCSQGIPVDHKKGAATGTVVPPVSPGDPALYLTGSGRRVGIVAAYDIFGFEVEQTRLFCDQLASAVDGTVVMPDYFRGGRWKKFPITDRVKFEKWIGEVADVGRAMRDTIDLVTPHMKQLLGNDCPLAVIGFCWGGWLVAVTLGNAASPFACGVGLHPSRQSAEDISRVRVPIALFPAENDPEMAAFVEGIPDKKLASRCLHKRFSGVQHGWCTKRSNMKNMEVLAKVKEAIADTAAFILDRTGNHD